MATVLDPINLIGVGAGGMAAKSAAFGARKAGQTAAKAASAGRWAGFKRGLIAEGAINAGIEAGMDAGIQARDIEVGLQDEYSVAQGLLAAGAGG